MLDARSGPDMTIGAGHDKMRLGVLLHHRSDVAVF